MANINTQTQAIDLTNEINLDKSNNNVTQFVGFTANNGVVHDSALHPLASAVSHSQSVITKDGRRIEIVNTDLLADGNIVHSFTTPHFEIENIEKANKYSVVDYYENAEKSVILTNKQIIITEGSDERVQDLGFNAQVILSSYVDDTIAIICFKDDANGNFVFWTDYTEKHTQKLDFETYVNQMIYNKNHRLISLVEATYDKAIVVQINNDTLTKMSFATQLENVMFRPAFVLENDLCGALQQFQNYSNSPCVFDSVFAIQSIVGSVINYTRAGDNSLKNFSSFACQDASMHTYYNNGFYSQSALLNRVASTVQGYSTKENVTVIIEASNTGLSGFAVQGVMDKSGLVQFNVKNVIDNYYTNAIMFWCKGNWYYSDTHFQIPYWRHQYSQVRGITGEVNSWREGINDTRGTATITVNSVNVAGSLRCQTPVNNRKVKTVKVNGDVVGHFTSGTPFFSLPITITSDFKQEKNIPVTISKSFSTIRIADGVMKSVGYWIGNVGFDHELSYFIDSTAQYSIKLARDFAIGLYITINNKKYTLDNNFKISIDDVEWGFADILTQFKITVNPIIDIITSSGFVLEKNVNPYTLLKDYLYNSSFDIKVEAVYRIIWEYSKYATRTRTIKTMYVKNENRIITNSSFPPIALNRNASFTGNYKKPVESTPVTVEKTIDTPIKLSVDNFIVQDTQAVSHVGCGADTEGRTWQYGKSYTKGAYELLYNNDSLSGISYSTNGFIGTLLTPWFSIDESFNIKIYDNTIVYRDTLGGIKRIRLLDDGSLHWDFVLDRYLVVNTSDYINCVDLDTMTLCHYASDYNGRIKPAGVRSIDDLERVVNNAYFITGINANYEVSGGLPSMIRNPIMASQIFGAVDDYVYKNCTQLNNAIDVYLSTNGKTNQDYSVSVKVFSDIVFSQYKKSELKGLLYPTIANSNIILSPSLLAKYTKSYFKSFCLLIEGRSYIGITQGVMNYPLYYIGSEFEGLNTLFNIQGIAYGVTDDKIYRLTINEGVLVDYDVVCKISGLQFCGGVINEAYFYSKINNSIYTFSGDNNMQIKTQGSKITNVYNSFYNTSTQDLYIQTNIGLLVFSQINNYLLPSINNVSLSEGNIKEIFFLDDNYYILTLNNGTTIDIAYAKDDFAVEPLKLVTNYYGTSRNEKTKVQCWNITLNKLGAGKGQIVLRAETLTNRGFVSNKKTVKISRLDWDKKSDTYFIRYQPQLQSGAGCRLAIESDFPIAQLSCDVMTDSKQLSSKSV